MRTVGCSSRLPAGGVCLPRGVSPKGVAQRVSAQGGVCPGGCLPREGCVSQYALRQIPPLWTEWLTDGCKNITFPQLRLWKVKFLVLVKYSWSSKGVAWLGMKNSVYPKICAAHSKSDLGIKWSFAAPPNPDWLPNRNLNLIMPSYQVFP